MPKGVRYTAQQKAEMRDKAQKMLKQGATQKSVAESLGVAIPTLKAILGPSSGKRKRGRPGRKPAAPASTAKSGNPVAALAQMHDRIADIDSEISQLNMERERLRNEMESVYSQVGKQLDLNPRR